MKKEFYFAISLFENWIIKKSLHREDTGFIIVLKPPRNHFDNQWGKEGFLNIYHPLIPPKDFTKKYRNFALHSFHRDKRKLYAKFVKKEEEAFFEVVDTWTNLEFYKEFDALKWKVIAKLPN